MESTFDRRVDASSGAIRPIRVFLAEDHQITLWGLRRLIAASPFRMEVAGTASSCAELVGGDAMANVDVVVLDLNLGGEDAGPLVGMLCQSGVKVLVLTASDDVAAHRLAVMKGARGVVHKSEPAEVILRAIEKVHGGEVWLHRSLLGEILGLLTDGARSPATQRRSPEDERIASLTPREREIVFTMLRSSGSKQLTVADTLKMSEHTLRNHLTTIYSKLGVRGRLELHLFATQHGLLPTAGSAPGPYAR
jgi:DNA-binding NarL/FixJ family response regulator